MKPEVKKMIGIVVGLLLAAVGAYFGIDFTVPKAPVQVESGK